MEKQKLCFFVTACLHLIYLSCYNCQSTRNELNDYIFSLNYNRDVILAYKGDMIDNVKTEGKLHNNDFIVIKREKKTLTNGKADIGVISTNEHITYPGSLLLANSHLVDNSPDVLAVQRAQLNYTVNLPGLASDGSFTIQPSFGNYEAARNKVLKTWFENYTDDQDPPILFQHVFGIVYSKEQIRVKLGLEFKNIDVELNIDFGAIGRQEKLTMIHKFTQIYYTVSVESPEYPADLFGPNVTKQQLAKKFNAENPPVIVDSISYGRVIYLKIETSSTDIEAKTILENKLNLFNIHDSTSWDVDYSKLLKDFSMQVYIMGGSSEQIKIINAKTVKDVNDIVIKYSKFSRNNLGYPVVYSSLFIKDNSRAIVNSVTDYVETTRTIYKKGIITIRHTGWFVAQWVIRWNELSYDQNGNAVLNEKNWHKNWEDVTAKFTDNIELSGNARNIHVYARECTGLAWEWWRIVFSRNNVPLIKNRTFSIWGSTLDPRFSIDPDV